MENVVGRYTGKKYGKNFIVIFYSGLLDLKSLNFLSYKSIMFLFQGEMGIEELAKYYVVIRTFLRQVNGVGLLEQSRVLNDALDATTVVYDHKLRL